MDRAYKSFQESRLRGKTTSLIWLVVLFISDIGEHMTLPGAPASMRTWGTALLLRGGIKTFLLLFTQSICNHYPCFENMGRFVTMKKSGPKYGLQQAGCKKQGHCYSKREEAAWPVCFQIRKISGIHWLINKVHIF